MDEECRHVKREEGERPSDDEKDGEYGKHNLHSLGQAENVRSRTAGEEARHRNLKAQQFDPVFGSIGPAREAEGGGGDPVFSSFGGQPEGRSRCAPAPQQTGSKGDGSEEILN